ncbi:MAG: hypothetical protein J2P17_24135 [Mycobacterium sp.]|nr:hypothetical protein [Mycobacterium sp.]
MTDTVQILCTNDFSGAWDPSPTHSGELPGGKGLRNTIERLSKAAPSVWVDVGDLATGGPLAVVDHGRTAWQAADSLGIDIAVPGNHEFDWGIDRFVDLARASHMTYLCANAKLGLPPTRIVNTAVGPVGFIGLTYPDLASISPDLSVLDQPPMREVVADHARDLRQAGAVVIIAAIHDGVDQPGKPTFLGDWHSEVDAVIAGHTLWPTIEEHHGVPVCQPAPYGAEVGVLELRTGQPINCYAVAVTGEGYWDGPGAEVLKEAREEVIGASALSLRSTLSRPNELLDALARTAVRLTEADAAIVSLWDCFVTQPVTEGVVTYLPDGPFTRADLMRYSPHADEPIHTVELSSAQFEAAQKLSEIPFLPTLGLATPTGGARNPVRVAASMRQTQAYAAALGVTAMPCQRGGRTVTLRDVWLATIAGGLRATVESARA